MKKVKPAVFTGPLGWGWVLLGELADVLGRRPLDVFSSFLGLSKDEGSIPVIVAGMESQKFPFHVWVDGNIWWGTGGAVRIRPVPPLGGEGVRPRRVGSGRAPRRRARSCPG